MFVTLFTRDSHLSLIWARWIHSTSIVFPSDQFHYLPPLSVLVFQAVTFLHVFTQKPCLHSSSVYCCMRAKTVTLGHPLVRSLPSSCVLLFGQFWGNRWNPLSVFDPPVFNSWNHGKGLLRKDISYSSRAERHRMRIGKGRVQQICEEIFRLSISFHDVPTLSPFPYPLSSFPCKWTNVKEGTQDKRVSSSLPHPHKQPLPSRNPILLQRNENYPTSIIYIPAPPPPFFFLFLRNTFLWHGRNIGFASYGRIFTFRCAFVAGIYLMELWSGELKCLVQMVPFPRALLLLFLEASAILWR